MENLTTSTGVSTVLDPFFFAILALAVVVVGAYLWSKNRKGRSKKLSGVGDIGQYKH